jgi:membrane-associated phospholipid phosphatase
MSIAAVRFWRHSRAFCEDSAMPMKSQAIRVLTPVAFAFASMTSAYADPHQGVENAGTAVAIALPVIAGGISLYHDDLEGLADLALVTGGSVGTAFLLKEVVKEKRPDGSDFKSFPSDTSALAFAPAFYLWHRYGWEYGVPAVAAASFAGWSRVDAQQHHWWDVAASAGIAAAFDLVVDRRYIPPNVQAGAYGSPDGGFVALNYRF